MIFSFYLSDYLFVESHDLSMTTIDIDARVDWIAFHWWGYAAAEFDWSLRAASGRAARGRRATPRWWAAR